MSAYRQAMLSVAPERLEQFSLEMKQNIGKKKSGKKSSDQRHHRHRKEKRTEKKSERKSKSTPEKLSKSKNRTKSKSTKRKTSKERSDYEKRRKSKSEDGDLTGDSDMEENGLDLKHDLHPLSHYVKDRQNLLDIMFQIVKGEKLTAMLPDILKNVPIDEVKRKCLTHLEVMSSKRINHILSGETMQSSSGTDSDAETSPQSKSRSRCSEAVAKEASSKVQKPLGNTDDDRGSLQTNFVDSTTSSGCEVLSLLAAGSQQEDARNCLDSSTISGSESQNPSRRDSDSPVTEDGEVVTDEEEVILENDGNTSANDGTEDGNERSDESNVEEEVEEMIEIVEDEEYVEMVDAMLEETLPPLDSQKDSSEDKHSPDTHSSDKHSDRADTSGLSQLELLELQLRARAIKSLMKAAQEPDNGDK